MVQKVRGLKGQESKEVSIKKTSDGAAVVNTELHWIPVSEVPPPSGKLQLIDQRFGVAVYGNYSKSQGWTHWQALPTFKKEQK